MGLVTDVFWICPGCGSRQQAQAYGEWNDPKEFPVSAVPCSRWPLKWNPPCEECGQYRLVMPVVNVACVPVLVEEPEDD